MTGTWNEEADPFNTVNGPLGHKPRFQTLLPGRLLLNHIT